MYIEGKEATVHPLIKGFLIVFYIHLIVLMFVWLGWVVGFMGILAAPFIAFMLYNAADQVYTETHKDDEDDSEPYDMKNPDLWP